MLRKIFAILFVLSFMAVMPIQAADFPTKEVQIIIPWAAGRGNGSDFPGSGRDNRQGSR